jgi:hypothetical protein
MTKQREVGVCETFGAARCIGECRFPGDCSARPLSPAKTATEAFPKKQYESRDFPAEMAKIWAIRPDTRDDDDKDCSEYRDFGGY